MSDLSETHSLPAPEAPLAAGSSRLSVPEIAQRFGPRPPGRLPDARARHPAGPSPRPPVDHHAARFRNMGENVRNENALDRKCSSR